MKTPLISIIVPVHNVGPYLEECLKSIHQQTFKNFEVWLIDDGSTDNSASICCKFAKFDNRFRYLYQDNLGVIPAREKGIRCATGELITFIDADDKVDELFIETLSLPFILSDVDLVICGFYWWYPQKEQKYKEEKAVFPKKQISNYQLAQSILGVGKEKNFCIIGGYLWNKMFKTESLKQIKTPFVKGAEDEVLLFQLLPSLRNIHYIDKPLYFYRQRASSLVKGKSFPYFLALSRKKIMDTCDDPLKTIAGLGFARSVVYLIINILLGREEDFKHIKDTKELAEIAHSKFQSDSDKHIRSSADERYKFLLWYRKFPTWLLFILIKYKFTFLTTLLASNIKKIKNTGDVN